MRLTSKGIQAGSAARSAEREGTVSPQPLIAGSAARASEAANYGPSASGKRSASISFAPRGGRIFTPRPVTSPQVEKEEGAEPYKSNVLVASQKLMEKRAHDNANPASELSMGSRGSMLDRLKSLFQSSDDQ